MAWVVVFLVGGVLGAVLCWYPLPPYPCYPPTPCPCWYPPVLVERGVPYGRGP